MSIKSASCPFYCPSLLRFFQKKVENFITFCLYLTVFKKLRLSSFILLAILVLPASAAPTGRIPARVLWITDGDTIGCAVNGRDERVRLIGVDSPETHENEKFERDVLRDRRHTPREVLALGRRARDFVKRVLPPGSQATLEIDVQDRDRYGRLLAYVWFAPGGARGRQVMLNALLVSEGWAKVMTVPPDVKYAETFYRLQKKARMERKGIWAR